ncbi:MAG: sirohydrochlorin chelatase [Alkalinema sp. RU_4_3]|nr:sirohydrochlorin chelatase [Alkalinema sp. RU_4_3]
MLRTPAYVFVSHGSRDPRPAAAIAQLITDLTTDDRPLLGHAMLECAPEPLSEQLITLARTAQTQGFSELRLVPLFLLPGVHVTEDIPLQVQAAQAKLGSFPLTQTAYLGTLDGLQGLLKPQHQHTLLLSHGSRKPGGNALIERLAQALDLTPSFWSVEPKLETTIAQLVNQGATSIAIKPFFLTQGGITDAIAAEVARLADIYPQVSLTLENTLDRQPGFREIVLELFD